MLYNLTMKGFPLSSRIFILTYSVYFAVKKCPYATSIYLSFSNNDPVTKYEISDVMWQFTPEYKTQLVSYKLSTKYTPGISALDGICAIEAYILCNSFCYELLYYVLSIIFDHKF